MARIFRDLSRARTAPLGTDIKESLINVITGVNTGRGGVGEGAHSRLRVAATRFVTRGLIVQSASVFRGVRGLDASRSCVIHGSHRC